jgi:hypothetical protein
MRFPQCDLMLSEYVNGASPHITLTDEEALGAAGALTSQTKLSADFVLNPQLPTFQNTADGYFSAVTA